MSQQFALQMEQEIQKQIQEQRSEAGPGSLAPVRQLGDAATIIGSRPSLPLPVFPDGPSCPLPNVNTTAGIEGTVSRGTCPVLTCRPVHRNHLSPPEVLESCPVSQSGHGRAATRLEPLKAHYPPDEKKRRSNSCPRGEAEPKRGRSSGAEPSWNLSQIGG